MSHVTSIARPSVASPTATEEPAPPRLQQSVQPTLVGGGRILPIIPQTLAEVRQVAEIIARGGAAPRSYRSDNGNGPVDVDMVSAAILVGLEVGLPPGKAVAGIVMLDDGPMIWGDARDGLVAASGLLADMKEEMVLDEDGLFVSATCTVWRKDRPTPIVQTVTRAQAALAGWLENDAWKAHPNRMAQMRAKGWANRDAFPDVLKGLKVHDEEQDFIDVTAKGAASTAPPQPRRADFVPKEDWRPTPTSDDRVAAPGPAVEARSQAAPAEEAVDDCWPLHDETGETVGTFPPARWAEEFERLTGKLEGPALVGAIDNNRDVGIRIATDHEGAIGPIIADGLRAIFAFTEDDPPSRDEKVGQSVLALSDDDLCPVGDSQEETAERVIALIRSARTVARVNRILQLNAARMKPWRRANREKVTAAADAQLENLQLGEFDR